MTKLRLDALMAKLGIVEIAGQAQPLVMAGQVRVDGQVVLNPSTIVSETAHVEIAHAPQFVSRGGEKLQAALLAFGMEDLSAQIAADIGASTGGFTDCLLQHGVSKVYSIDVGYGELHWRLRTDPRVVVMERTNARYISRLPEPLQLVTIDASFISLRTLLPVVAGWFDQGGGRVVGLVKPQFEAGRKDAARGKGVIRDPSLHVQILRDLLRFISEIGFTPSGLIKSPLLGPKGNVEFLVKLEYPGENKVQIETMIQSVLNES